MSSSPYVEPRAVSSALKLRGPDPAYWEEWAQFRSRSGSEIPEDADRAWVSRVKNSHRGICKRRQLRHLVAAAVNQPFLDEIGELGELERLDLEYPVTASDLTPLLRLRKLVHLSINSPRNIADFGPLLALPALRRLFIENAKHLTDLEWLGEADHLEAIGIEGSIWTPQHVASLAPLSGLRSVRGLFLTSVRLKDKNLSPLADCPSLQLLQCARFAPRSEFEGLQRLRPELECSWFDPNMWS